VCVCVEGKEEAKDEGLRDKLGWEVSKFLGRNVIGWRDILHLRVLFLFLFSWVHRMYHVHGRECGVEEDS